MKLVLLSAVLLVGLPLSASAEILMQVRLEVNDLGGTPISTINAGDDFLLKCFVQDLRDPPPVDAHDQGVFAAYTDVAFDSSLATAMNPFSFGSAYPELHEGTILPGLLQNAGAAAGVVPGLGLGELLLFSVNVHAEQLGQLTFTPTAATSSLLGFSLFGMNEAISPSQVQFIGAEVSVVPEPSSLALAVAALFVALGVARTRRAIR